MKLPVFKLFKLSFANVWQNRQEWTRLLFAPWVVLLIGELLLVSLYIKTGESLYLPEANTFQTKVFWLQSAFSFFVAMIASAQMTINSVRYALLEEGGNRWWTLPLNHYFAKMMGYDALTFLIMGLTIAATWGITFFAGASIGIGGAAISFPASFYTPESSLLTGIYIGAGSTSLILAIISMFYVATRIGLYYIFIVLDKKCAFRSSWRLVKGHMGRLLGLTLLIMLAIHIPFFALTSAVKFITTSPFVTLLMEVIKNLFATTLVTAVIAKAGSLVYQTLAEGKAVK